jgi:hypothetical protein
MRGAADNAVLRHAAGDMLASCGGDRTVRIWSCHGEVDGWCCDALLEEVRQFAFPAFVTGREPREVS